MTTEHEDIDAGNSKPWQTEVDWWYRPNTLPQYDLLVAQGEVSQEEADGHRKVRAEMGLAMTVEELKAPPEPGKRGFEWVERYGGPRVTGGDYDLFTYAGAEWHAWSWSGNSGGRASLDGKEDSTGIARTLSDSLDASKPGVRWRVRCALPGLEAGSKIKQLEKWGECPTFDEAHKAVMEFRFDVRQADGLDWYADGEKGESAVFEGRGINIQESMHGTGEYAWSWETSLKTDAERELSTLMNNARLGGYGSTREEVLKAAKEAPKKLIQLLVAVLGEDAFARGVEAGIVHARKTEVSPGA